MTIRIPADPSGELALLEGFQAELLRGGAALFMRAVDEKTGDSVFGAQNPNNRVVATERVSLRLQLTSSDGISYMPLVEHLWSMAGSTAQVLYTNTTVEVDLSAGFFRSMWDRAGIASSWVTMSEEASIRQKVNPLVANGLPLMIDFSAVGATGDPIRPLFETSATGLPDASQERISTFVTRLVRNLRNRINDLREMSRMLVLHRALVIDEAIQNNAVTEGARDHQKLSELVMDCWIALANGDSKRAVAERLRKALFEVSPVFDLDSYDALRYVQDIESRRAAPRDRQILNLKLEHSDGTPNPVIHGGARRIQVALL